MIKRVEPMEAIEPMGSGLNFLNSHGIQFIEP